MNELNHIEAKLNQLIVAQAQHSAEQKVMQSQTDKICRGLYGDPDNGYPGLISNDKDQEARIKSLEESRARIKWTLGGIAAATQGVAIGIYEWFKDKI